MAMGRASPSGCHGLDAAGLRYGAYERARQRCGAPGRSGPAPPPPLPKFQSIRWSRAGTATPPPSEPFPAPILQLPMRLALDLPACSRLRSARHMLGLERRCERREAESGEQKRGLGEHAAEDFSTAVPEGMWGTWPVSPSFDPSPQHVCPHRECMRRGRSNRPRFNVRHLALQTS
jgi:hypothetical protein